MGQQADTDILEKYGALLENSEPSTPLPQSLLPCSKEKTKEAILCALKEYPPVKAREAMTVAYLELAWFVPGDEAEVYAKGHAAFLSADPNHEHWELAGQSVTITKRILEEERKTLKEELEAFSIAEQERVANIKTNVEILEKYEKVLVETQEETVVPQSLLPFDKKRIKNALIFALRDKPPAEIQKQMIAGYMRLAKFIPDDEAEVCSKAHAARESGDSSHEYEEYVEPSNAILKRVSEDLHTLGDELRAFSKEHLPDSEDDDHRTRHEPEQKHSEEKQTEDSDEDESGVWVIVLICVFAVTVMYLAC
jgi:hypothetical protein